MRYRFFISLIFIFIVFANNPPVRAQDTFGPVCDLTTPGVTCVPTATSAPLPTSTPRPTTPPQSLPVAGGIEPTFLLLAISGVFTLGGITSFFSSYTQHKQK